MDSGVVVPTLSRGVSTTSAVNLLTRARGVGAGGGVPAWRALPACARLFSAICGPYPYFDSLASRAEAADWRTLWTAGISSPMRIAKTATTTSNSMRVNARRSMGEHPVEIETQGVDDRTGAGD